MGDYSIGMDLGGTNLRAAAISREGEILDKVSGSTNLNEGPDVLVQDMVEAISKLRDRFGTDSLAGIGVGVPGFIVMKTGLITDSPNLPLLKDFPIRDALSERLGARVILENDANAAALGEKWRGSGRDVDDLILLTLGTGVGGGIIINGKILHGFVGMAAEIGHTTVNPTGNPCGCGNRGCLEKHASASAVEAMAGLMGLGDHLTAEQVFHMAEEGNEKARDVYRAAGETLGIALATLASTFNFPLYLLSGGMIGAWDHFAPAMLAECRRRSFVFRATEPRVEKAQLGSQAGLYGAAYLAFQE